MFFWLFLSIAIFGIGFFMTMASGMSDAPVEAEITGRHGCILSAVGLISAIVCLAVWMS